MESSKYLIFDLETGGLDPKKNPVLQGFFLVTDENFNNLDELEFFVKPSTLPKEINTIDEESLKINNLSLSSLEKEGVDFSQCIIDLENFLKKHKKSVPLGYNILFDIRFVESQMCSDFSKYTSHKIVDVYSSLNLFKMFGFLPPSIGTLESLGRHLNVKPPENLHNAKLDVMFLIEVLKKLEIEMRIKTNLFLGFKPEETNKILNFIS